MATEDKAPKTIQETEKRHTPLFYMMLLPKLVHRARELGYALTVHGSLVRDLDLVAIPWVDVAVDAEKLIGEMVELSGGILNTEQGIVSKPHGRVACCIYVAPRLWIDLSVMPRAKI